MEEEILLCCDFSTAISLGKTCKSFKQHSDTVLDKWVDIALARPAQTEENELGFYENVADSNEIGMSGAFKRGWCGV